MREIEAIWKDISGYEGIYKISSCGKVKSLDRELIDSIGRKKFFPGKLLNPIKNEGGYLYVKLSKNGKRKHSYVHRLVAINFLGDHSDDLVVNHIDGIKENNSLNNLEWVTHQENEEHAVKNGLNIHGGAHHESKLNKDKVIYIRKHKKNKTFKELAKELGVTQNAIFSAYHGITWKHIK